MSAVHIHVTAGALTHGWQNCRHAGCQEGGVRHSTSQQLLLLLLLCCQHLLHLSHAAGKHLQQRSAAALDVTSTNPLHHRHRPRLWCLSALCDTANWQGTDAPDSAYSRHQSSKLRQPAAAAAATAQPPPNPTIQQSALPYNPQQQWLRNPWYKYSCCCLPRCSACPSCSCAS